MARLSEEEKAEIRAVMKANEGRPMQPFELGPRFPDNPEGRTAYLRFCDEMIELFGSKQVERPPAKR